MVDTEEKFKEMVFDMRVGVLQGPRAEILLSNPAALELLGLTEDQLLGKTSFDPEWKVIHERFTISAIRTLLLLLPAKLYTV
jgi:PAS domain S-box-containing protein